MTRSTLPLAVFLSLLPVACGGTPKPEPAVPEQKHEDAKVAAADPAEPPAFEEKTRSIPKECASEKDGVCTMPKDFLKRLCNGTFPNVALVIFGRGTPWTHGYLTRKTQAWNAEGGASVQDYLSFDEEVVLLAARMPPKDGMQVSGAGGYQALRWNGSCVTLSGEEVTMNRPPSPKHPRIEWRYIEDGMREGLRKDPTVDGAVSTLKKECHGVSEGDVSKKCVDADGKLGDAIVAYVLGTGDLPEPAKLP